MTNIDILKALVNNCIEFQLESNPEKEFSLAEIHSLAQSLNIAGCAQCSDKEVDEAVKQIVQEKDILYDVGHVITNKKVKHDTTWIKNIESFQYWERYKNYLNSNKGWNLKATINLKDSTKRILQQCGDPNGDDFSIKGLVIGNVQSGKTANYTALANMAIDAGYKIVIVLAGMQNDLRKQTQIRLDEELVGTKSNQKDIRKALKKQLTGVGKINKNLKMNSFTSVESDFTSKILNTHINIENSLVPSLFVIKKNSKTLQNLIEWIKTSNLVSLGDQLSAPILLIDDESDNGSINTNNSDDNPTTINRLIRELLGLFSKSTYLAVTATPFANIFIDDVNEEDLFPSDFIYALSSPPNYIGAEKVFLDKKYKKSVIQNISLQTQEEFPLKHKKDFDVCFLPDDLAEAIYFFLVANAVRDIRGHAKTHRSMMVNMSRYTDIQNIIAELVENLLNNIKTEVRNYAQLTNIPEYSHINKMKAVWNKNRFSESENISWIEVQQRYLYNSIKGIEVQKQNMKSESKLNYEQYEEGKRVIVVGGQSLSRGLTIEGLMVSYFYRSTIMYDTLMQMARWFGYRPGYEDLVRVWMTEDMSGWFEHITMAIMELTDRIHDMNSEGLSPQDFGLMVKKHPESTLLVTARNKMRNTHEIEIPVNLSASLVETPYLPKKRSVLLENEKQVRIFIDKLNQFGTLLPLDHERARGQYLWENVPSSLLVELINRFRTDPSWTNYNQYGLTELLKGNLIDAKWDVALIKGDNLQGKKLKTPFKYGDSLIELPKTEQRKVYLSDSKISITNNRAVAAGGQMKIGLTEDQLKKVNSNVRRSEFLSNIKYLGINRNPILLVHVIDPIFSEEEIVEDIDNLPDYLFALSFGFPGDAKKQNTVSYIVNEVFYREMFSDVDEDE